ncbi:MAG TPA: phosphopantetheine-binding protein [Opitutus sp.]|nr:phosphopantetheine-binding protein [Opitutus sp.]
MTESEIRAKVRAFLEKFIQDQDFQDADNIFALGLVNSLMAMQLVLFLEKEFAVKFSNQELNLKNFHSVDAMVALLGQRGVIAAA